MKVATFRPARQSAAKPLFRGLLAWSVGLAVAALVGIDLSGTWMVPLFAGSAVAGFLIWRGYRWPDSWSPYLSFGGALLIALIANRFLYIADFVFSGERFSEWPFFSRAPEWATFKAEIITIAGTLITMWAWLAAGGAKYSPMLLLDSKRPQLIGVLSATYFLSMIGLVISRLGVEIEQALGQLLPTLHGLGIASSFFLPIAVATNRLARLGAIVLLSLPFIYFALLSGMKEEIIISLVPTGYAAWLALRTRVSRLAFVSAALLILPIVTSYVGFFRFEAWQKQRQFTQQQALQEFADSVENKGFVETLEKGALGFLSRGNAGAYRGWAVSLADERGYEPRLVFEPMIYVFIPRILWPEKPRNLQAWEYSGLVFGQQYIAWSTSSTSAGLYTGLYLGYGWLAVLIGALFIGALVAGLLKLAWRLGGPPLVGLYVFGLLPFALRLDEAWAVGGLMTPIISFVYVVVLFQVARLMGFILKIR